MPPKCRIYNYNGASCKVSKVCCHAYFRGVWCFLVCAPSFSPEIPVFPPVAGWALLAASRCATRPLRAQGSGAARTRGGALAGGVSRIRGASGS